MPDLKQVFAQEISRLARKELKKQSLPLVQANAKLRQELAEIKKSLKALEKAIAVGAAAAPAPAAPAAAKADAEQKPAKKHRFSSKGLHSYREKLHLAQAQLAKLIGVSTRTVCLWEAGKSAPQAKQLEKIYSLRALGKRALKQRCLELGVALAPAKKAAKAEKATKAEKAAKAVKAPAGRKGRKAAAAPAAAAPAAAPAAAEVKTEA
jgi:DNA-binding transcriptional regulator YiaG